MARGEGDEAAEAPALPPTPEEVELLAPLRRGDEAAFTGLIDRHHGGLRRLARTFVSSDASADEVVQETWLAVLHGLRSFEGRSSLKTWIFSILVNRARTRAQREGRSVPLSSLGSPDDPEPAVDPTRFDGRGMWSAPPAPWAETPEAQLLRGETMRVLEQALAELPERQRMVVVLRDVEGWSSDEVCNVLGLSETNQRVLLHRARSRLRSVLERFVSR